MRSPELGSRPELREPTNSISNETDCDSNLRGEDDDVVCANENARNTDASVAQDSCDNASTSQVPTATGGDNSSDTVEANNEQNDATNREQSAAPLATVGETDENEAETIDASVPNGETRVTEATEESTNETNESRIGNVQETTGHRDDDDVETNERSAENGQATNESSETNDDRVTNRNENSETNDERVLETNGDIEIVDAAEATEESLTFDENHFSTPVGGLSPRGRRRTTTSSMEDSEVRRPAHNAECTTLCGFIQLLKQLRKLKASLRLLIH